MWDPYAFTKEANYGLAQVETGTAPGFLLFLWKQTPTVYEAEEMSYNV